MGSLAVEGRHVYYEHFPGSSEKPKSLQCRGLGMSNRIWDDVTAWLVDAESGVVACDQRNRGQSSKGFSDVSISALADIDQRNMMRMLDVPALVVCDDSADSDGVVDPAIGGYAAKLLLQGKLVTLKGVGLAPFIEQPDDYRTAVLDILQRLA